MKKELNDIIKQLKALKKKAEKDNKNLENELHVISIEAAIRSLQIILVWKKLE